MVSWVRLVGSSSSEGCLLTSQLHSPSSLLSHAGGAVSRRCRPETRKVMCVCEEVMSCDPRALPEHVQRGQALT